MREVVTPLASSSSDVTPDRYHGLRFPLATLSAKLALARSLGAKANAACCYTARKYTGCPSLPSSSGSVQSRDAWSS